jgi:hypothetical protein
VADSTAPGSAPEAVDSSWTAAADGRRRQPPQADPLGVLAGQGAEGPPQPGAVAGLVVAVGEHQQAGQLGDAPGQPADHVQGGVVGPVQVLDHQQRRPAGQLPVQGVQDPVAVGAGLQGRGQGAAAGPGHVAERAQGPRGGQVVAHADQRPDPPRGGGQLPDQAGLADAGLAGDQRHRAVAPTGPVQRRPQAAQLGVTLEQSGPHGLD